MHVASSYWLICCCCSIAKLCLTLRCHGLQHVRPPLSITISQSLLKLMSIELMMPSNYLILLFPSPAFNLSQHQVFSKELALPIRWPEYWSFSFSISLPNEYSRLISFRMDWFDHLAVQGTLKSLLQHHNLKASVLRCSAFLWSSSHICT